MSTIFLTPSTPPYATYHSNRKRSNDRSTDRPTSGKGGDTGRPTSKRAGRRPPGAERRGERPAPEGRPDEEAGRRTGQRGPGAAKRGTGKPAASKGGDGDRPASKRAGRRPHGAVRRGERPKATGTSEGGTERGAAQRAPGGAKPWRKAPGKPGMKGPWRERKRKEASDGASGGGLIRLNRFLAQSGVCSRREADDLIKAGVVSVNGKIVTEMGAKVYATDKIHYGGQRLSMEKKRYVLLNKPKGFITTTDDPKDRKTVMALVEHACTERLYPVGRLDRATTGLLLLTNDGDLAKKLTHPSHGAEKLYHVTLDKAVTKAHLVQLVEGVELEDGPAQADEAQYVEGATKREVGVKLHMGRNRVVRRMFEALGYEVLKLDRVVFAGLTKKDLPRSHWRHLTEKEVLFLSKRK